MQHLVIRETEYVGFFFVDEQMILTLECLCVYWEPDMISSIA